MAYKTIANLKDSISGMLQGINLNNVKNINTALERAARKLCQRIDIPEATGKTSLSLYDGVLDYLAPTDIFGGAIIDIRPQGMSRNETDYVYRQNVEQFDRTQATLPNGTSVAFEFNKGVGIARIKSTRPMPKIELDPFNATTGWTAAGSASGLTEDDTVYYNAPASLRFTLTGASSGTITKTIPSQDLTNYVGVGVVFLAIRTPDATNLTSIAVKLGSSASNYYSVSTTTGFLGAWTAGEWVIVALDLSGATTTGTPTVTAITYAQITITHGATLTNFYVGDFWIALPSPHTMIYQTPSIFLASGVTTPSSSITNTADQVLLNDSAYAIYEIECALEVAGQQGGTLASGVINSLDQQVNGIRGYRGILIQPGLYDLYRTKNPSQELRPIGNWYDD